MRYFSTFSGIGGFELGIKQAYDKNKSIIQTESEAAQRHGRGVSNRNKSMYRSDFLQAPPTCIGYSELDKYAIETYQKNFPNHKNYGDITTINEKELPDFDLLVGGFPCQSFSIAGKRGGFDDTRGTLFFDLARIVREKQPRNFIFENVKGLLSHDQGNTFRTIISTLDELGYDCEWQVLNSKNFGVPQNRERVYIIGHLREESRPKVFPILGATSKSSKDGVGLNPRNFNGKHYVRANKSVSLTQPSGNNATLINQPFVRIAEANKKGYAVAGVGDSINLSVPTSKTRRGRVSKIANTLDTGMQQDTLMETGTVRRLTPTECERLQGFPDGWTEGVSDSQRYKQCGNAVTVNVVEEIIKRMYKKYD